MISTDYGQDRFDIVRPVFVTPFFGPGGMPVSDRSQGSQTSNQSRPLVAFGASVVLTIIGSVLAGIGTAISAVLSGRSASEGIDRRDERDKEPRHAPAASAPIRLPPP
jgi:hypothetical protein